MSDHRGAIMHRHGSAEAPAAALLLELLFRSVCMVVEWMMDGHLVVCVPV